MSPSQGAMDVSVRSRTDWECLPDTWVLVPTPMPSPEQHNGRKGPSEPNSPCPSPSCVCTNAEFTLGSAGHAHAWGRQAPRQTGGCDLGAWAPSPPVTRGVTPGRERRPRRHMRQELGVGPWERDKRWSPTFSPPGQGGLVRDCEPVGGHDVEDHRESLQPGVRAEARKPQGSF